MERVPVSSTSLDSVGYDLDTQTLEIAFKSDRVYRYFHVPPQVFADLMRSDSHGTFFNDHILDVYEYSQVE
jgi:hypothetical protein